MGLHASVAAGYTPDMLMDTALLSALESAGWKLDGQMVVDENGEPLGELDAEMVLDLVRFFGLTPVAEA